MNLAAVMDADQDLELNREIDLGDAALSDAAIGDVDLRTRVVSYLAECHMPGLRQLAVEARNGVVTISGRVKTYYEKQVGGQRARRVAGVVKLVDRIDVAMA